MRQQGHVPNDKLEIRADAEISIIENAVIVGIQEQPRQIPGVVGKVWIAEEFSGDVVKDYVPSDGDRRPIRLGDELRNAAGVDRNRSKWYTGSATLQDTNPDFRFAVPISVKLERVQVRRRHTPGRFRETTVEALLGVDLGQRLCIPVTIEVEGHRLSAADMIQRRRCGHVHRQEVSTLTAVGLGVIGSKYAPDVEPCWNKRGSVRSGKVTVAGLTGFVQCRRNRTIVPPDEHPTCKNRTDLDGAEIRSDRRLEKGIDDEVFLAVARVIDEFNDLPVRIEGLGRARRQGFLPPRTAPQDAWVCDRNGAQNWPQQQPDQPTVLRTVRSLRTTRLPQTAGFLRKAGFLRTAAVQRHSLRHRTPP